MKVLEFRKTNHFAVLGFLMPFVSAGVTGFLILVGADNFKLLKYSLLYLTLVPVLLLGGLILSIKSIPLIEELGDKDYAYSGLALNLLFIFVYIVFLIFFFTN